MSKELRIYGGIAIVDDEDYAMLAQYKWYVEASGYAKAHYKDGEKNRSVRMHRIVAKAKKGEKIDHRNRNKLDNRKENLRSTSDEENARNKGIPANNSSGYKGVTKHGVYWNAQIFYDGKNHSLGYFKDKHDAARAYNKAALEHHGEYAHQNEIEEEK